MAIPDLAQVAARAAAERAARERGAVPGKPAIGAYTPTIPWGPVSTFMKVTPHPAQGMVSVVYETAQGVQIYILDPDSAIDHAEKLLKHAREVKSGLTAP